MRFEVEQWEGLLEKKKNKQKNQVLKVLSFPQHLIGDIDSSALSWGVGGGNGVSRVCCSTYCCGWTAASGLPKVNANNVLAPNPHKRCLAFRARFHNVVRRRRHPRKIFTKPGQRVLIKMFKDYKHKVTSPICAFTRFCGTIKFVARNA